MPRDPDPRLDDEILIEMNRIGGSMEVRAISAADGLEIVFTAPANALKLDVEKVARAKLAYVRKKSADQKTEEGQKTQEGERGDGPEKPGGKRGLIA